MSGRRGQCCITARCPCLSHPGGQRGQHTHRGLGEPAGRGGWRPPWDPGVTREVALSSKAGPPAPLCPGAWRAVTFCSRTRQPARAPGLLASPGRDVVVGPSPPACATLRAARPSPSFRAACRVRPCGPPSTCRLEAQSEVGRLASPGRARDALESTRLPNSRGGACFLPDCSFRDSPPLTGCASLGE